MIRKLLFVVVLLAVIGSLWLFARTRPVLVDLASVTRGGVRAIVEEEGRTRVRERYIVSAPVAGRLFRSRHEEGDVVTKGALIAEIDPLPLKSRVEEAEARVRALERRVEGVATRKPKPDELERARLLEKRAVEALDVSRKLLSECENERDDAAKTFQRATLLARDRTIGIAELDEARTLANGARQRAYAQEVRVKMRTLEIAMARLDRAVLEARVHDYDWEEKEYKEQITAVQAALSAMRDDLKRTRIEAPVGGIILKLVRESEQVVAAGTPLLEIGDLKDLEVEVDFLSEDVARMRVGMPVEIFGRAVGEHPVKGAIRRIYPSAFTKISSLGVEQQRVNVIASLGTPHAALGDLYRVEVRVILEAKTDVLLVPEGALFRSGDSWHVFAAVGGRARLTKVTTGIRDGRLREVLSGLEEGQLVILHPAQDLESEARIEPLN